MPLKIEKKKCSGCGACITVCPYDAIKIEDGKAVIGEYCQLCQSCIASCTEGAIEEYQEDYGEEHAGLSAYSGIWIFAEQRGGRVAPVAFELLGEGGRLAAKKGVSLSAVLFGATRDEALELIKWGAGRVYFSDDEVFKNFEDEPNARLLANLIEEHKPEVVLAGVD